MSRAGGPCSGGLSLGTGVALKEQRAGWFPWHQGHRFALRAWWGGGAGAGESPWTEEPGKAIVHRVAKSQTPLSK